MFTSEIGGIQVPNQQEGQGKRFDMMFSYLAAKGDFFSLSSLLVTQVLRMNIPSQGRKM